MVSLNYLASHSRNMEALLQTYRQIDLTIQSVFLVMGSFLLSRILEASSLLIALFFEVLLISLSYILKGMRLLSIFMLILSAGAIILKIYS